jgi:hypothetical protein
MSQLILMIAKMDELDNPEKLTELWRQTTLTPNLSDITPAHYLNELESQVDETGWEAMRHLLVTMAVDRWSAGRRISPGAGRRSGCGWIRPVKGCQSLGCGAIAAPGLLPSG